MEGQVGYKTWGSLTSGSPELDAAVYVHMKFVECLEMVSVDKK